MQSCHHQSGIAGVVMLIGYLCQNMSYSDVNYLQLHDVNFFLNSDTCNSTWKHMQMPYVSNVISVIVKHHEY